MSPTTGQTLKTDKALNTSEPKYLHIDAPARIWPLQCCGLNLDPDPEFGPIWIRIQGNVINFANKVLLNLEENHFL